MNEPCIALLMWETLRNLSFEHPIPVLLAAIPGLLNLYLLYYLHTHILPNDTSRTFAFYIRALLIWELRDVMFRLSVTSETAYIYDNVLSSGYIVFAPIGLLFALKYAGFQKLSRQIWLIAILFLPALIFQSVYGLVLQSVEYYHSPFWGWYHSYNKTRLGTVMVSWIFLCGFLTFALFAWYAWRSRHVPVLSKQSLLLAIGRGILWVQAFITQYFMPQVLKIPGIPIASATIIFFSICVFIALKRYRLFQLLESKDSVEKVEFPPVGLITISPDAGIIQANGVARNVLKIAPLHKNPVPASTVLLDEPHNRQKFSEILAECLDGKLVSNRDLVLLYQDKGPVKVILSAKPVFKEERLEEIILLWRNPV